MVGDGSANVAPTLNYYTFTLAKDRHSAVGPFLTGVPQPLAAMERYLWSRYDDATYLFNKQRGQRGQS